MDDDRDAIDFLINGGTITGLLKEYKDIGDHVIDYIITHHSFNNESEQATFVFAIIKNNLTLLPKIANYLSINSINYPKLFNLFIAGYQTLFRNSATSYDDSINSGIHRESLDYWHILHSMFKHINYNNVNTKLAKYKFGHLTLHNKDSIRTSLGDLTKKFIPKEIILDAINHGLTINVSDLLDPIVQDRLGNFISDENYIGDLIVAGFIQSTSLHNFDKGQTLTFIDNVKYESQEEYLIAYLRFAGLNNTADRIEDYLNSNFDPCQ